MKAMTMHAPCIRNGLFGLLVTVLLLQAAPATAELRGFHWNGTAMELRSLDPTTGLTQIVGTVSDLAAISPSAVAVNQSTGVMYLIGEHNAPNASARFGINGKGFVFQINAHTGVTISGVPLDADISTLYVRNDGVLIGLSWTGTIRELREIDPSTGTTSFIAQLPPIGDITPAGSVLDQSTNELFIAGKERPPTLSTTGSPNLRLFVVDAQTGSIIRDVATHLNFVSLHLRSGGDLVGVTPIFPGLGLRSIDRVTGSSTLLGPFLGLTSIPGAASELEPSPAEMIQIGLTSVGVATVVSLNPTTGTHIRSRSTSPPLANLFRLDVSAVAVLVASYDAAWAEDHVEIRWTMASEAADETFQIQRRSDEGGFAPVSAEVAREDDSFVVRDDTARRGKTYTYRVSATNGPWHVTLFEASVETQALAFALLPARPNPFAGSTRIEYTLDRAAPVSLTIVDVSGRAVRKLDNGTRESGIHSIAWDGRDRNGHLAPSGTYFVSLRSGAREVTRKIVFMN